MVAGVMIFIFGLWGFVLIALVYSSLSRIIRKGTGKSMPDLIRKQHEKEKNFYLHPIGTLFSGVLQLCHHLWGSTL